MAARREGVLGFSFKVRRKDRLYSKTKGLKQRAFGFNQNNVVLVSTKIV
jgi:hypothetical protein